MARGRNAPHTVETERAGGEERSVADTGRLGIDPDVGDRPAHAWEVDEAESWEPVMPDTWEPPADAGPEAEAREGDAWSDTAPRGRAWPPTGTEREAAPPQDRTTGAEPQSGQAERPTEQPGRSPKPASPEVAGERPQPPPARLALGLASLAAQRMRGGVPAGDGLVTGLGLMRQTVNGLVALGERLLAPASRAAAGAVKRAEALPVVGPPIHAGLRTRQWLARTGAQAREKIAAAAASRLGESGREQVAAEPSRELVDAREASPAGAGADHRPGTSTVDRGSPAGRQ